MANYPTGLNGWVYMSKTEYNSISHDENTKYTVRDGNSVTEYLGDVMIVSEEGDSWVTMAVFEEQMGVVQDVIDNINDRVVALENWKTNTVTPKINEIISRIEAIETWKSSVDSALTTLFSKYGLVVISDTVRVIEQVNELPVNPSETTLYVISGDKNDT